MHRQNCLCGKRLRRGLRCGRGFQMRLYRRDQRRKTVRIAHGHVRQNLAIDFNPARFEVVNQLAVRHAVRARSRANTPNPERAKIALAIAAVAITVPQRTVHRLLCRSIELSFGQEKSLGMLQQLLTPCAALGPAFDSSHFSSPMMSTKPFGLRGEDCSCAIRLRWQANLHTAIFSAACSLNSRAYRQSRDAGGKEAETRLLCLARSLLRVKVRSAGPPRRVALCLAS